MSFVISEKQRSDARIKELRQLPMTALNPLVIESELRRMSNLLKERNIKAVDGKTQRIVADTKPMYLGPDGKLNDAALMRIEIKVKDAFPDVKLKTYNSGAPRIAGPLELANFVYGSSNMADVYGRYTQASVTRMGDAVKETAGNIVVEVLTNKGDFRAEFSPKSAQVLQPSSMAELFEKALRGDSGIDPRYKLFSSIFNEIYDVRTE